MYISVLWIGTTSSMHLAFAEHFPSENKSRLHITHWNLEWKAFLHRQIADNWHCLGYEELPVSSETVVCAKYKYQDWVWGMSNILHQIWLKFGGIRLWVCIWFLVLAPFSPVCQAFIRTCQLIHCTVCNINHWCWQLMNFLITTQGL
jgi:hypothetical protein